MHFYGEGVRGLQLCMALMNSWGVLTGSRAFSLSAWLLFDIGVVGWAMMYMFDAYDE